jgi:hypothetical protein
MLLTWEHDLDEGTEYMRRCLGTSVSVPKIEFSRTVNFMTVRLLRLLMVQQVLQISVCF